MTYCRYWRR